MVQKSISISVTAAVVVAGILTLSVLAAISSTKQAFAQFEQSGPVPCHLTVSSDPSSGSIYFGESIGAKIYGKLTCSTWGERPHYTNMWPVGGATIDLTGLSHNLKAITDSSGNYHKDILVGPQTYTVKANYAGESCDERYPSPGTGCVRVAASGTTTMHFTVK